MINVYVYGAGVRTFTYGAQDPNTNGYVILELLITDNKESHGKTHEETHMSLDGSWHIM